MKLLDAHGSTGRPLIRRGEKEASGIGRSPSNIRSSKGVRRSPSTPAYFLQNVRTAPLSRNRSTSSVSPASETYSAGMRHKCPAQVNCQSTGTACAGAPWGAVQKFFP
ncbi:hypothetical protein DW651_09735 [Subdoligranulum sp. AM23-21AC]|nr:hypothetical protein DW651_09735 [Subdoligranulum sp. AM23-21AC]